MFTLKSPAKINLFLRILKRRSDGYHDLASLFQAIDLFDIIHFQESHLDKLSCDIPTLKTDSDNLIVKARDLFKLKTGINRQFTIHLEKKIPMQAGLGGGSSNAATTLWGLNELCGRPASEKQLCEWGAEIGSDVPFFLSSGTAYCTGRGEILQSLSPLKNESVYIVKPPQGLSTPQVFANLNLNLLHHRDPEKTLNAFYEGKSDYFNDLELPAFELLPELLHLKEKLKNIGFSVVLMSGSGSSFFCLGDKKPYLEGHEIYHANFTNRQPGFWFGVSL